MVPFRDTQTGLTAGTTYSLTISWEALKGGTHAYDYITTYTTTETTADPCTGVAGAVCTSLPPPKISPAAAQFRPGLARSYVRDQAFSIVF